MGIEVKICGLSTADTLEAALDAGADLVGFVHFPKSPRHVALADAPALVAQVRGRAKKVLLLVNPDDATLDAALAAFQPDIVQLHGSESPERVAEIRACIGRPVMKALPVARAEDLATVPAYAAVADRLLFDAKPLPDDTLPGGNGRPFDWNLLAGLDPGRPVMLSGGLDAGNLPLALSVAHVDGVDVSSGVETAPGRKSAEKIFAFVQAARAAAAQVAEGKVQ
ncbi:N-(5'-phosphoribosyl)anthranilate isomerase [Azorhizobium oxalatiphilum]|uniref:N-(5'-phosphoribosyl)anthranilate isomerase n=1 Tax=Azorhizobium oxalatiphilum TaxID=980631 RepID=A0A917BM02_9HYPH|nr:phosphoribosylanthranilate isomerase [Azorhizobium oxalatiphilum]GGF49827.1 N-(5'-phosphoribosyl)anthranilate isomerase [Azorhizobium oxalatiphilum]